MIILVIVNNYLIIVLGIPPVMTGQEIAANAIPDLLTMLSYLTQIYETFRGEIPHIKHPKLVSSQSFLEMVPAPNIRLNLKVPNDTQKDISKVPRPIKSNSLTAITSDTQKDMSKVPRPINSNSLTAITSKRLSRLTNISASEKTDSNNDFGGTGDFRPKKKLSARDMIKIYTEISSETEKKIENLEKKHSLSDVSSKTNVGSENITADSLEVLLSPTDQYSLTNSSVAICSSRSTHNLIDDTDYIMIENIGSDLKTGLYSIPEEDEYAYNSDKEHSSIQNLSKLSLEERESSPRSILVLTEPDSYFSAVSVIPSEFFMGNLRTVSSNETTVF